jgi:hypothetical protein
MENVLTISLSVIVTLAIHCKVPLHSINKAIQSCLWNTLLKEYHDRVTYQEIKEAILTEGVFHDINFLIQ